MSMLTERLYKERSLPSNIKKVDIYLLFARILTEMKDSIYSWIQNMGK